MSKGDFSGCSFLNNRSSGSSYMTNQALRRLRHLHTSIATQKWRKSRVDDERSLNIKKCLADLSPRAQAFAISLGPVAAVSASPIKCEPCVYSARDSLRISQSYRRAASSRDSSRVPNSRESSSRGNSKCGRCHNRIDRDQSRSSSTSGIHCVNMNAINDHDAYTVIQHGAFIPRRRILTHKPRQRRCKWTENLDIPLDGLRLDRDETGTKPPPEVTKALPSISVTKSDQVYSNVRQTLDVKNVRLKTPPPSPSVRHINVHLPAS